MTTTRLILARPGRISRAGRFILAERRLPHVVVDHKRPGDAATSLRRQPPGLLELRWRDDGEANIEEHHTVVEYPVIITRTRRHAWTERRYMLTLSWFVASSRHERRRTMHWERASATWIDDASVIVLLRVILHGGKGPAEKSPSREYSSTFYKRFLPDRRGAGNRYRRGIEIKRFATARGPGYPKFQPPPLSPWRKRERERTEREERKGWGATGFRNGPRDARGYSGRRPHVGPPCEWAN